jgi:Predicted cobalamin binding protein
MPKTHASYTIRQVIELTGVSEFTLRAWENRYQVFNPQRTQTGRRLYSTDDVFKARTLADLVSRGHKISHLAELKTPELKLLLQDHSFSEQSAELVSVDPFAGKIIALADQYDWEALRKALDKKRKSLSPRDFIYQAILPIVREMNAHVASGEFSVAQEHVVSSLLREHLSFIAPPVVTSRSPIRLVMACPEGEYHELGLLIAQALAKVNKVVVLYLGSHMPKRELVETCLRSQATHVLLSTTLSKKEGAKEDILDYLNFMDRQLGPKVDLWLAGRNAQGLRLGFKRNFCVLSSFEDLEIKLTEVGNS